ncbi:MULTISPECIES: hypothetical protein [unclassified Pseudoalteromonas]|uniref:hypothetical protein n=1 Tax=unclassified Pseudoalteromonas TaxID=194690 RepID=UPI001F40658E|nr:MULTISPECIES: hypothetical protein [unclassified Pseudoalteromonas]MCF2825676.1 hypothetical protein [Pseudoalteromonas sp. OF5H-5]MCF2833271.1 hypothetical protein [Pseudoalteromonas sp. DL2-H6]MCF2923764.1 hypothetical protein [Pseudoalteromonas sp. DL2-H1]
MTVNGIFTLLGQFVIALEVIALGAICFLSYQKVNRLVFGGKSDINSERDAFLHSCFITAVSVAVFHVSTSTIREMILGLDLERMELRQVFYFFMFIMEMAFIVCVFSLHKIRGCSFSHVARVALLLALVMCANQIIQFFIRGVIGLDYYMPFYKGVILFVNIGTLMAVGVYPLVSSWRLRNQY